jgi:hypothetical protein
VELKKQFFKIRALSESLRAKITNLFYKSSESSSKKDVNWSALKFMALSCITLFIVIVMLLPDEQDVQFSQKAEDAQPEGASAGSGPSQKPSAGGAMNALWAAPSDRAVGANSSQANYNTSMILSADRANSHTQLRPGIRLPVRIADKFIVSDAQVPVLAEVVVDVISESGLKIPAGTKFYGEASYQKGQERAQVRFTQLSLVSGEIRSAVGRAFSKDGQPGLSGRVYTDGPKNTAGSLLTTFIAGLASGSMETDVFGSSQGGLKNGILSAVAGTAKDRAQSYGEKLKTEREWIEIAQGTECNVVLDETMNLQSAGRPEK